MTELSTNSVKGRIWKRLFQESTPNFPKNEHFLPPDTHYQEVSNVRFSENLTCFVFLKHPWDSSFCLITDDLLHRRNFLATTSYFFLRKHINKRKVNEHWKNCENRLFIIYQILFGSNFLCSVFVLFKFLLEEEIKNSHFPSSHFNDHYETHSLRMKLSMIT